VEKEEKIVVILLCMALLSLTILYATFYTGGTKDDLNGFSPSSLPGEDVRFEGDVLSKRFTYTGGHLLMDVDYGAGVIKVFIPSGSGAKDVDLRIDQNDRILVSGTVNEYNGELEVIVQNSNGVVLLN